MALRLESAAATARPRRAPPSADREPTSPVEAIATSVSSIEPSPASAAAPRSPWPAALAVTGVAIVVFLSLFASTVRTIVDQWLNSQSYSHGLLIVPVSLYLIWRRRHIVAAVAPRFFPLALVPLAGAAFVWLLGDVAGIQVVQHFALVGMLWMLVLAILGWEATRRIAFPLFFLVLAVPFGDVLTPPLQDVTAVMAVRLLEISGVPVHSDRLMIYIPSGSFIVAEACSGLRFLTSSIAIGVLGANLFYRTWWRRILFLTLSFVIPIIANGIRAYGIVLIAYLSDHTVAVGVDHIVYGWVFLSFVTLCLLGVGMTFRERHDDLADFQTMPATPPPVLPPRFAMKLAAGAAAALFVVAAAPAYSAVAAYRGGLTAVPELDIANVRAPWAVTETPTADWRPIYAGADAQWMRTFSDGAARVDLFVAYYRYQHQGAEVVSNANSNLGDGDWRRTGGGRTTLILDGREFSVPYDVLMRGSAKRLVWTWYWVDDTFAADPTYAKVLEVRGKLLGGDGRAAAFVASTPVDGSLREAEAVLRSFLKEAAPLASLLRAGGDRAAAAGRS